LGGRRLHGRIVSVSQYNFRELFLPKSMDIKKPQLAQILGGIALLQGGISFAVLILLSTLLPPGSSTTSQSLVVWLTVAIFFIIFVELSLSWTKQAFSIRSSQLQYDKSDLWTTIGHAYQYVDASTSLVAILFFVAMLAVLAYFVIQLMGNQVTFSTPFFTQLAVYALYLLVRRPLKPVFSRLGTAINNQARGALPTYQLTTDAVIVDLNITDLEHPSKKCLVKIGFDEIDELRSFSYAEAQTFARYQIGPNVSLLSQQTRDLYNYLKGNIARPTVYGVNMISSGGTTVFLRGPTLFYFLTFNTSDVRDLMDAYESFKRRPK
jgi:hypothetical protein